MKKHLHYLFLFITLFWGMKGFSQNMIVKISDGNKQISELSTLKKLTFSDNSLVITYSGLTSSTVALSNITGIYFGDISAASETILLNNDLAVLSVYPNPAKSNIYLKNAPSGVSQLAIYRADGKLMKLIQLESPNNPVDVSDLVFGLYILKVNNQSVKFVKL